MEFVQGEKNIRKYEENGRIVMVKEHRIDDDLQQNTRDIVIKVKRKLVLTVV